MRSRASNRLGSAAALRQSQCPESTPIRVGEKARAPARAGGRVSDISDLAREGRALQSSSVSHHVQLHPTNYRSLCTVNSRPVILKVVDRFRSATRDRAQAPVRASATVRIDAKEA
jgi:hypothetical protein